MTSKRISDQINTIRVASEKASASSETALAFLRSAGIIPEVNQVVKTPTYHRPNTGTLSAKTTVVRASGARAVRHAGVKKSK
jgi:hypothetical protein